ncbi:MAG: tetratricopeptide repeat protein [Planctomycetaceae bacterium]|nr:tetratricopeptide repeat protein [Planctomycetaceae bacterium]
MNTRLVGCAQCALVIIVAGACVPAGNAQEMGIMQSQQFLSDADKLHRSQKPGEALELYLKAAEAAEKAGDVSVQAEALAQIARMYSLTSRLDEGRTWLERAKQVASPDHPLGWSRYLGVRGIFERESRQKEKAVATFTEMYEYCSKHKLHSRAIDAAHHVALAGTLEQQVEWGLKGVAEAEKGDKGWLGPLWNNLGNTYDELGQFDKALDAFLKARDFHNAAGNPNTHIGDYAVAKAYRKTGNVKLARENLALAKKVIDQRIKDDPSTENREWLGWFAWEDGELLVLEDKRAEGLKTMKSALDTLIACGLKTWGPYFEDLAKKMEARVKELEAQN